MNKHTENFLVSLLWNLEEQNTELEGKTIYDFSPKFVAAVDSFIDGFIQFLIKKGFDISQIDNLTRSFGGNVYFSLSGAGVGFFDDSDGEELQTLLEEYSGNRHRFEQINIDLDIMGELDLSILPEYIDKRRNELFLIKA